MKIAAVITADKPAWAPDYHASAMMVPVVFVTWTLSVLFATLAAYVALRLLIRCGHLPYFAIDSILF